MSSVDTKTFQLKSYSGLKDTCSEELVDILNLVIASVEETDPEEKVALSNGVIHECDRLLQIYDPQRDTESFSNEGRFPIDSAAFYNAYGQALHSLWYEHFEMYCDLSLYYFGKGKKLQLSNSTSPIVRYTFELSQIRTELSLMLKEAVRKFKSAYKWSLRPEQNFHVDMKEGEKGEEEKECSVSQLVEGFSNSQNICAELTRCYLLHLIFYSSKAEKIPMGIVSVIKDKLEKLKKQPWYVCVSDPQISSMQLLYFESNWNMLLKDKKVSLEDFQEESEESDDEHDDDVDENAILEEMSKSDFIWTTDVGHENYSPSLHALYIVYESLVSF